MLCILATLTAMVVRDRKSDKKHKFAFLQLASARRPWLGRTRTADRRESVRGSTWQRRSLPRAVFDCAGVGQSASIGFAIFLHLAPPRVRKSICTPSNNTSRSGTLRIVGTGLANAGWWRSPRRESTRTSTTTLSRAPVGHKVNVEYILFKWWKGVEGLSWPFFDVGR